ncbi:MAG: hypothetical protein HYU42_11205 [Candidatus Rokubacteria bacterium]|nr:hypothetical protein [Candidatus Rokubacteria bacterium]
MIHEYALEPELVATWVDRGVGRYFIEKFGLGQPRIVSRYPKRWKRLVWEAFTSGNDVERARMTELLERLRETMVKRRDGRWDPSAAWLHNAEDEHARVPFHAILARSNPRGLTMVLVADEIDDATPLWGVPRGCTVPRTAMDMAAAVASMLRIADVLVFVDPHFGPENGRHRRPLERFLRSVVDARPGEAPRRLEVQSSADGGSTTAFFCDECRQRLPVCIPIGLRVEMVRLRQRPGGERLHNRYILTDLGGVIFGVGLDEGDHGDTDDIQLLDRAQYEERWRQYAGEPPAFDRPEPAIRVEGAAHDGRRRGAS